MPNMPLTRRLIFCSCLALFAWLGLGCDSNQDAHSCEVFETCDVQDELKLTLIENQSRLPANVSILFKVNTDDELPVPYMLSENFDIYENENRISRFESDLSILPKTGTFKYSIVLLLDLSGSIVKSENLAPLKEAAQTFVDAIMFESDDARYGEIEMSIWWFDGQADIDSLVAFVADPDMLNAGIGEITESITVDNSTNLYGAVVQGLERTEQRLAASVRQEMLSAGSLVIFTDGTDQANRVTRGAALDAVKRAEAGMSVYTIGLGGEIDDLTLKDIGSNGSVFASNIDELVPRFQEIADLVRAEANSYYLLEYCSPKRDGENDLIIRAEADGYVGLLSTRFSARNFSPGCAVSP